MNFSKCWLNRNRIKVQDYLLIKSEFSLYPPCLPPQGSGYRYPRKHPNWKGTEKNFICWVPGTLHARYIFVYPMLHSVRVLPTGMRINSSIWQIVTRHPLLAKHKGSSPDAPVRNTDMISGLTELRVWWRQYQTNIVINGDKCCEWNGRGYCKREAQGRV